MMTFLLYYGVFALATGLVIAIQTMRNKPLRDYLGRSTIYAALGFALGAIICAPIMFFLAISGRFAADIETELLPSIKARFNSRR